MNNQYLFVSLYLSHTVYCLYKMQYHPALLHSHFLCAIIYTMYTQTATLPT